MEWKDWLKARMDEQGLVAYTLAERASKKVGRRIHASSIQRQLSGERGIQADLANSIAAGLGLPQTVVHVAAGIKTDIDPTDQNDPDLLIIFKEVEEVQTPEERKALLLLIRAYKAGRAASSKRATARKQTTGRTQELVSAR